MKIDDYVDKVHECINEIELDQIDYLYKDILLTRDSNKTIYVCGNGGSAAMASHFYNDLIKVIGAKARCLNDNVPLMTAISNDIDYSDIFNLQLYRFIEENDMVIFFSTSGLSENILTALHSLRDEDIIVYLITGSYEDISATYGIENLCVIRAGDNVYRAEDMQSIICHMLANRFDEDR